MDVVSGSAVFIAVLTSFYSLPYVEGVVVMALSFLILKVGLESIRDSTFVLMDVSPSREIETEIRKIIGEFGGVESFNDLKLRKSGPFIFGEVKVRVKKHQKVFAAHELAEAIEAKIKERIPEVDSLIIHLEPCQMGECRIAIPLKTSKGMNSALAEGLSGAPYLMFADVNKDEKLVRGFKVEKNPAKSTSVRRGLKAAEFISSNKVDFVLVRKISPVPFHTLSDKMVEIYTLDGKTAREAIDNFLEDRLDHLLEPNKPKA